MIHDQHIVVPVGEKAGGSRHAAPRVAVIVPAYGVAHLVGEALASVQAQTMDDWECVVVDDGAPDDVAGAVAPFLADSRITFIETENGGVSAARNRAIAHTSAPLVTLLDGDDMLRPDYLATMTAALEAEPDARLVTCNARIFGAVPHERNCFARKQGKGDGRRGILEDVIDRSFSVYIGSTFRRADFDAAGGFDTTMTHAEDFDFWVRLVLQGGYALYIDKVLCDYRVRGNSASASSLNMLKGNIRTFEKALAALPSDASETKVAKAMITRNARQLRFEQAIDRVIDGDKRAITDLRATRGADQGRSWDLALFVWRFMPALAAPMLRRRREANARGAAKATV
ncbi:glycosyltransferase family A protein [Aurantiacibacter marinus]|uniref:Glycosyltransferase 2-like domain-containing protein n=1 Tax=Aurantiacibacter marinus TaxID=874156 RepID=A0A0H0XSR1_9SPHN|nr:glycosyltransferase family A protein [Aurantiacibacter marinus]KLI65041.1 hypothetical protein AAV99_06160 [Aurantiacibacter marinus]